MLIGEVAGLGPGKPLPGLAEVGGPLLAAIWSEDRQPLELLENSSSSLLGHRRLAGSDFVYYLHRVIGGYGSQQLYLGVRSEEHTSELQSLMRISYAVFCFNKKTNK